MNKECLLNVIISNHISEKSNYLSDKHKQFVFIVRKDATKQHITAAVELVFKVKVKEVRVLNVKPEVKYTRGIQGKHKAWKKAYVSVSEGDISFITA